MISSEELLETTARGGSIDLEDWPRVLEDLLQRLHDIVYNEFPIPSIPLPPVRAPIIDPEVVASTPPSLPTADSNPRDQSHGEADTELATNSQSSTKENDTPADSDTARAARPMRPLSSNSKLDAGTSQRTEEMPSPHMEGLEPDPGTLPPELLSLYQTSARILQNDFAHSPPYTIQRLSEMILQPKRHYRYLPAYLRALDRIVSVSSPVSDFPLPTLHASTNGGFLTNGEPLVNGITERDTLGSDESLGGALLTPIPWLINQNRMLHTQSSDSSGGSGGGADGELHSESTETIDGPHGAGSIETVSVTVNGVPSTSLTSQQQQQQQPHSSPITSPTLSEQSDASTSSASSTEAQLREQGGVTQGELLRQEQEAGVVPVDAAGHPMTPRRQPISAGAIAVGREPAGLHPGAGGSGSSSSSSGAGAGGNVASSTELQLDDEIPHARGPNVIGMEDMGPQQGRTAGMLDLEAAVGRGRSKSPQPPPSSSDAAPAGDAMEDVTESGKPDRRAEDVEKDVERLREAMEREKQQAEAKDADGDVIVTDADGQKDGGSSPG